MFPATTKDTISNDVKLGANRIRDDVRQTANDVHSNLEITASKAGRKVREYFDSASEEVTHAADAVTSQIRSNPVQSSLLALGAGFIIGALLRR
jgi:ElaB/YqjD/DUF883 family membrane-anchored ribosome-binding protein